MEESISSSRTTAFYDGNSYYCNYHYHYHHHHQQQQPPAAAAPAAVSDFDDAADSGWTAYFLQLPSDDEEEEEDASASNREKQQQLRDVGAVPACGRGSRSGSASTVSKPNKAKDNKQAAVKKVLKKGVKKTRIVEEEDPLQDTASSPLLQLNITGRRPAGSLEHSCKGQRPATSAT